MCSYVGTVRDRERLFLDKGIELSKKDIQLREKDIMLLQSKIAQKDADLLRVQGKLTGRGIYEHILKHIGTDEGLKGTFNAANVCSYFTAKSSGTLYILTYIR